MPVRNQNWYDLQASRRYPLDERSTGVDDAGQMLHDDVLVDCHIRFPSTLGQYLFVQGVTISPGLATIVFGAATDLNDATPVTVAALSLPRTAPQNVNHAITPLVDGVAGWAVLGPGLDEEFVGRYSTPIQTLISQRCARPYRALPVPSLGKLGLATGLQGVITLLSQTPVTTTYISKTDDQALQVDGQAVNAIVFKLEGEAQGVNPLSAFLGPCSERPESGTCPKPPIETINGLTPDCDGNINIVFEGLTPAVFEDCGGVDILANTGLSEACAAGPSRRRRRAVQDNCVPGVESIDDAAWYNPMPQPPTPPDVVSSESIPDDAATSDCALLPLCVDFSLGTAPNFVVREGLFVFDSTVPPPPPPCSSAPLAAHYVYAAANVASRNIALFKNCASDWSLSKTIGAELQITPSGLRRNGGLVLNYLRGNPGLNVPTRYIVVSLNADKAQLQILRFNGSSFVNEYSAPFSILVNDWYQLTATPVQVGADVVVTVTAAALSGNVPAVSVALPIANYGDPVGQVGFFSSSSYTRFNKFTIEE